MLNKKLKSYIEVTQRSIENMKNKGLSKEDIKKNLKNISDKFEESKKDWSKRLEYAKSIDDIESIEFIEDHFKTLKMYQEFLNSWDN